LVLALRIGFGVWVEFRAYGAAFGFWFAPDCRRAKKKIKCRREAAE